MLKKMGIRAKIILSFGVILLFLMLISAAGFLGLNFTKSGFERYRKLAIDSVLLGQVQENLLLARINVKDYIQRNEDLSVTEFNEKWSNLGSSLKDSEGRINDKAKLAKIKNIDNNQGKYDANFKKIVEYQKKRNELLYESLNVIGPDSEEKLTEIMRTSYRDKNVQIAYAAGNALRELLLARLYTVKFLDENRQDYVDRVKEELKNFAGWLDFLDRNIRDRDRRNLLNGLKNDIEVYTRDFNNMVAAINSRNVLMEEIELIGPEISVDAEEVKFAIKTEQDDLGPKVQADNNRIVAGIVVLTIIALIVGFIFTIFLSMNLSGLSNGFSEFNIALDMLAKGDLTYRNNRKLLKRSDEVGNMARSISTVLDSLNNLISEVRSVSKGVFAGSTQISDAAQSLSQGASELASSVEEMSASIEEMESTIDQNSENAIEGEKIASKSAIDAKEGGEAVKNTVESMKKIADTIQIISEIANNTNMLALNAAIEAARAGEHGEGFAVVAAEVRKLAERTLKAADEIKSLSKTSVDVADKAGELISAIVPNIVKTSDMVQEIASASKEQKTGMKQLTTAAGQQEQVTQMVSANSEELASTAEEMTSQAQNLVELVSTFKIDMAEVEHKVIGGSQKKVNQNLIEANKDYSNKNVNISANKNANVKEKQYTETTVVENNKKSKDASSDYIEL